MRLLPWTGLVLLGVAVLAFAQNPAVSQPDEDESKVARSFQGLVHVGDWILMKHPLEKLKDGGYRLRLFTREQKEQVERAFSRWQARREEYTAKRNDLSEERNELRRKRDVTRQTIALLMSDEDRQEAREKVEQFEQQIEELGQQLDVVEQEYAPPVVMGDRWYSGLFSQVVAVGNDYLGYKRDGYITYIRLAEVEVVHRQVEDPIPMPQDAP